MKSIEQRVANLEKLFSLVITLNGSMLRSIGILDMRVPANADHRTGMTVAGAEQAALVEQIRELLPQAFPDLSAEE